MSTIELRAESLTLAAEVLAESQAEQRDSLALARVDRAEKYLRALVKQLASARAPARAFLLRGQVTAAVTRLEAVLLDAGRPCGATEPVKHLAPPAPHEGNGKRRGVPA